jgi:PAS domain S-box-containing protein
LIYEATTALLNFSVTDSQKSEALFHSSVAQIPEAVSALKDLVKSNPSEAVSATRIERLANRISRLLTKTYQEKTIGDTSWLALSLHLQIFKMTDALVTESYHIAEQEKPQEQKGPRQESHWRNLLVVCLLIGVSGSVLLTAGLVAVLNSDILKRLDIMMDNVNRFSGQLTLNQPVQGKDEIAQLDLTFHRMADALSVATQKERALIENSVDVICSLDARLIFTAVSPSSLKIWQSEPGELIAKPLSRILKPEYAQETLAAFHKAGRENGTFSIDTEVLVKDGTYINTYWSGRWSDKDQSFICIARDTTEQKKIERLKREFVEMVGHDLKTPLMSTELFLTFLSSGANNSLPEDLRAQAQLAELNVSRLVGLVKNLLDLEKWEAGKMRIERTIAPAERILQRSVAAVQAFADNFGVSISIPQTKILLFADEDSLVQVLVNLLSNAIKFSERGQQVTVTVSETVDDAEFKVIDHGRGVPEDFRTRIFNPYEQVHVTDNRLKGGSGLGLAICKSIVDMHGGEIGVDSEPGKGSTFWFRIPSPDSESPMV